MNHLNRLTKSILSTIGLTAGSVFANEGHGMAGSHWHATDTWGFVALGGAIVLAIWFSRNGR